MRRSFVRLIVGSVLLCWAAGSVVVLIYANNAEFTEARARRSGVFLVYEILAEEPASRRAERLDALRPHFSVELSLIDVAELERRLGRLPAAGQPIFRRERATAQWYYFLFVDRTGALAVGPVNATIPPDAVPIGLILAFIGAPIVAALLALRLEPELSKVEKATQALAVGEFSARVDNPHGPSNELAASFNAMAERVERLVRSRDELVQAVSHELGSPLSRLRFHLELLGGHAEERREERLEAMRGELAALDELVGELLGYAQSDNLELDRVDFDPRGTLADLAELTQLEVPEEHGLEIELRLDEELRLNVDPRLFQRAVENLLRNARQHARSRIRLELTEAGGSARISVHDDGPGIPEAMREKVTTPFYRLQADRDRKTGGVGLGLAIVRRIMDRHGGQLEVGTSPLGGARVTTVWPAGHGDDLVPPHRDVD